MMGKTPENIKTIRPLRAGVIADLEVAEQMIKHFISKAQAGGSRFSSNPEVVDQRPVGRYVGRAQGDSRRGLERRAGKVSLIDEPMAAAIGAGLPVRDPIGSMVVDIGGGTTEVGNTSRSRASLIANRRGSAATRWTRQSPPTCAGTTIC